MQAQMFSFLVERLLPFGYRRAWRETEESFRDVQEILAPSWNPFEYVPEGSRTQLFAALANGVAPFTAVMRVLVTHPEGAWPAGFKLLYQSDQAATRAFDEHDQSNWHLRNAWGNLVPTAIDPPSCGCTECLIGEYIPLQSVTTGMMRDMVAGYIRNNTYQDYWVEFEQDPENYGGWRQKLVSAYH